MSVSTIQIGHQRYLFLARRGFQALALGRSTPDHEKGPLNRPPRPQAKRSRPLGSGTGRPSSRAVSSHWEMTLSAFASAACLVRPSAAQPGNSGTSAINASSSSLQYSIISYFVIGPQYEAYFPFKVF